MLCRTLVADSGRLFNLYCIGTLPIFRQQSITMAVAATDIASPSAHKNPKFASIPDVKIDSLMRQVLMEEIHHCILSSGSVY
jgi:hypothetical protein